MSSEILLVGEIRRNCDFAVLACGDMTKCANALNNDQLNRFWLSAESFLVAVANISKILWPSPPTSPCKKCNFQPQLNPEMTSRRESIRKLLSVEDSSPLRSRKFRNHFEHYDERIEEWATKPAKQLIFDSNIGAVKSIIQNPSQSVSYRRNFDSSNFVLYFDDEEYHINEIIRSVKDLKNKSLVSM
jgi:hypothetical protein